MSWSPFVTSVESMKFHLDEVIDLILADIDKLFDAKSRHVILCADEILLCLDQRVPNEKVQAHFNLLVDQIGSILESNTRVHFILSSPSLGLLQDAHTPSSRAFIGLPMYALSARSVDSIYSHCWQDPKTNAETQQNNRQLMLDAAGSPGLLYSSSELLSADLQSLESLRPKLENQHPFFQLQETITSPHIRNALLVALKSSTIHRDCDPCLALGLLVMKKLHALYYDPKHMVAVIPPSVFYYIHPDPQMDPIINKLITLTRNFFSYGCPQSENHGTLVEDQFHAFLQLLCLTKCSPMHTQPSSAGHNEDVQNLLRSLTKSLSLLDLLNVTDGDEWNCRLTKGAPFFRYGSLFGASYHIPADLKVETSYFNFKPGTIWISPKSDYQPIDALLCLKNEMDEKVVFGLQYNWSRVINQEVNTNDKSILNQMTDDDSTDDENTDDETTNDECTEEESTDDESTNEKLLDCNTIAKAIFNTCKHHRKELWGYINSKRFGFIYVADRDISIPRSCHNDSFLYQQHLKGKVEKLRRAHKKALKRKLASAKKRGKVKAVKNYQLALEASKGHWSLVFNATQYILILGKEQISHLLPPTLKGRVAASPTYSSSSSASDQ